LTMMFALAKNAGSICKPSTAGKAGSL